MNKTLQNIILERLCSALTGIVMDILKYCEMDQNAQNAMLKNISGIKQILELSSNHAVATVENPCEKECVDLQPQPRITRQAAKRKNADITKVPESQPKRGKTDATISTHQKIVSQPKEKSTATIDEDVIEIVENVSEKGKLREYKSEDLENELVALDRLHSIFISGLPAVATEKALRNHIQKKVPTLVMDSIEVVKMPVKKDHSSFIVKTTHEDIFTTLNDNSF
ncbi:hypothetical protein ACFFRR_005231 [Megaselia abdita]